MSMNSNLKTEIFLVLSLGISVCSNSPTWAADPKNSVAEMQELEEQRTWLKTFGTSQDLAGIERAVDENLETWEKRGIHYYAFLILTAVETLASEPFDDNRQYELARRYAWKGLEKAGMIPLEVEINLLQYVEADLAAYRGARSEEWAQERTVHMKLWFQAWERLLGSIDPTWDPDDLPASSVSPPSATGLPAGVMPEAIKDPHLRAQYKAAVEANREKSAYYRQQYRIRKLDRRFSPKAERYIITAYSQPPPDFEELQKFLLQYVESEMIRRRITEAVEKNVSSNEGGAY